MELELDTCQCTPDSLIDNGAEDMSPSSHNIPYFAVYDATFLWPAEAYACLA